MLKRIQPALPHAAILLANMVVVFFLIDRVNTAMNFIDNPLTKGVLLAVCALAILNWKQAADMERRRKARRKKPPKRSNQLSAVAAGLSVAGLMALLLDALFPAWSLFLKGWMKWSLLALCAAVIAASGAIAHRNRARLRRKLRRQKKG